MRGLFCTEKKTVIRYVTITIVAICWVTVIMPNHIYAASVSREFVEAALSSMEDLEERYSVNRGVYRFVEIQNSMSRPEIVESLRQAQAPEYLIEMWSNNDVVRIVGEYEVRIIEAEKGRCLWEVTQKLITDNGRPRGDEPVVFRRATDGEADYEYVVGSGAWVRPVGSLQRMVDPLECMFRSNGVSIKQLILKAEKEPQAESLGDTLRITWELQNGLQAVVDIDVKKGGAIKSLLISKGRQCVFTRENSFGETEEGWHFKSSETIRYSIDGNEEIREMVEVKECNFGKDSFVRQGKYGFDGMALPAGTRIWDTRLGCMLGKWDNGMILPDASYGN